MAVGFTTTYNGRITEVDDLLVKREFFNDGTLWTWGGNASTQLGINATATNSRSSPGTTLGAGANWKSIETSASNSVIGGVKTDGTLWMWGFNADGQLGDNSTVNKSSPVTTSGGGTNWKQLAIAHYHATGIKTDGTLWTWGRNASSSSPFVWDAGALGDGGATNRSSPGTTAGGGTNWKQVSAAWQACAAIKTDGTLWTWGNNRTGQLGTGTTTARSSPGTTAGGGTNWSQISLGFTSNVEGNAAAIKTDGTLWTWGDNTSGTLGIGTTVDRSSPGTTAGGGTNWKQVAVGLSSMAAIKTDGTLWTWGLNDTGQLGTGNTTARSSPGTTAGGGTTWKQVDIGGNTNVNKTAAAVKTDGTLWTWGSNVRGQLGENTTTNRSSPGTTVGGITNWKQVTCGYGLTAGVTDATI